MGMYMPIWSRESKEAVLLNIASRGLEQYILEDFQN